MGMWGLICQLIDCRICSPPCIVDAKHWRCNHCLTEYANPALRRLVGHLSGVKGFEVGARQSVPKDVQADLEERALEMLGKKRRSSSSSSSGAGASGAATKRQRATQQMLHDAFAVQHGDAVSEWVKGAVGGCLA